MLKHYVQYDEPGILFSEPTIKQVNDRIPAHLLLKSIPKSTYALHFFDRTEVNHGSEVLVGEDKNHSITILFGVKCDLKGLRKLGYTEKDKLYRNIEGSFPYAVHCAPGNWQPAEKDDIVLGSFGALQQLQEAL